MLLDMYPMAVEAGIDAERYWDMSIREVIVQAQANRKRHESALKERAIMDHKLSELMAFAVNEPNKMPSIDKMYGFDVNAKSEGEQSRGNIPEWKKDQIEFMKQAEKIRNTRNFKQGGE